MLNIEMAQRVGVAELDQILAQIALHYDVKILNNGHGKIKIYNSRRVAIMLTGMAYSALRIKLAGTIKACGFVRNTYNGSLLAKLSPKLKGISVPVMDLASVTITADIGYSA